MVWEALPFGLRSAPMIFNSVAETLAYMIKREGVEEMDHYLDDFSLVGPPKSQICQRDLDTSLGVCDRVCFPVAREKTEGPATLITLLGIELDSVQLQLRLPHVKLRELVAMWRRRKACTKKELQSLAGHLSHACKVIRPGRRFLRGLFGLIAQFRRRDHMIRLNSAFRADLEWWHVFASGVAMMREGNGRDQGVEIWSDASGSWGCGAFWGAEWFQVPWCEWPDFGEASIAAKELLPIIVAVAVWGPVWRGQCVVCHCDNQSVVDVVRGGYGKHSRLALMLCCLFFLEAKYDSSACSGGPE